MAAANDLTTLNGLFKEVYADKLERLIPEGVKLLNKVEFARRDQQPGNFYHQPVVLGLEHGVTFGGSGDGAFTLENAVAGVIKDASVRGNQMVLRSLLAYSAAARSVGGGPKAFEDATKFLVGNMLKSMTKKLEIEMFYGQMGYGVISVVALTVLTIADAEWAPGIWAGAEGMPIEIRDASGATSRGTANVVSVSLSLKKITVDALPAGTVATDVIWHRGAYGKEFAGVHKIITNSGTLFGIDAASYNLWKGNEYVNSPTSVISFAIIQQAISKAIEKGLESDVCVMINPSHWDDLLTEQAALRRYDSSYSSGKSENGSKAIQFFSQNGMVEIMPSIYVKEGYAYVLCLEDFVRIGSTDITFKRPGQGDQFFRDVENSAAYELRAYTDQALFTFSPGKNVLISGLLAD